jgi:FkbH-like protein
LAKAQLGRQAARADSFSEKDFVATLDVETIVTRLATGSNPGADLARVEELFQRTTQFNTTGIKCSIAELDALLRDPGVQIFIVHVKDRFGDHGLVGAAIIRKGEISGLVLSCRVLCMGVEHDFLRHIIKAMAPVQLSGRITPTARNTPVRNLYRDNGFVLAGDVWRYAVKETVSP